MDMLLLVLLLIAHTVSDFYFKRDGLLGNTKRRAKSYVRHFIVVMLLHMLIALFYRNSFILLLLVFVALSHIIIDVIKMILLNASRRLRERSHQLFWVDQALHVMIILIVVSKLSDPHYRFDNVGQIYIVLKYLLGLLLLMKPSNTIISLSTERYHYEHTDKCDVLESQTQSPETTGREGAGALIGTLERILSAVLIITGQISAIGLIFTAKSIARFDRIQKDQKFAEYYLIGSLSSMLLCLFITVLIQYVF